MIYYRRHEIVTPDVLELIGEKDIMTGMNRFPVWRAKRSRETPHPIERYSVRLRQRDIATPAQRRRRERNRRTH